MTIPPPLALLPLVAFEVVVMVLLFVVEAVDDDKTMNGGSITSFILGAVQVVVVVRFVLLSNVVEQQLQTVVCDGDELALVGDDNISSGRSRWDGSC